jgi:serine/threonine protein kinase
VTRLSVAGGTVIRKEPLGPDAPRRLQHESAILEQLRGVAGVAQLVTAPRYRGSIVMEDVAGTSLVELATPVDVDQLIELAVQLARAVAGMHQRGVLHRDIAPANVVLSRTRRAVPGGFRLGHVVDRDPAEFTQHTQIVGTLAYLEPEQTTGCTPGWPRYSAR